MEGRQSLGSITYGALTARDIQTNNAKVQGHGIHPVTDTHKHSRSLFYGDFVAVVFKTGCKRFQIAG